jgi:hypothetical protein
MATYTPNLKLKMPALGENVALADLNGNSTLLDSWSQSITGAMSGSILSKNVGDGSSWVISLSSWNESIDSQQINVLFTSDTTISDSPTLKINSSIAMPIKDLYGNTLLEKFIVAGSVIKLVYNLAGKYFVANNIVNIPTSNSPAPTSPKINIQESEPTSPSENDLWVYPGVFKVYVNSAWQDVVKPKIYTQSTEPTSPTLNDLWFVTGEASAK